MINQKCVHDLTSNFLSGGVEQTSYNLGLVLLEYHNYLYYVENSPIISDYDYDKLFKLIKDKSKFIGVEPPIFGSDLRSSYDLELI